MDLSAALFILQTTSQIVIASALIAIAVKMRKGDK